MLSLGFKLKNTAQEITEVNGC